MNPFFSKPSNRHPPTSIPLVNRRLVLSALTVLGAAVLVSGCGNRTESAPKPKGGGATQITVTQSKQVDFEIVESTVGTVESTINPSITAEVAGRVRQVSGRAGAAVTKGQVLALIDPQDLQLGRQAASAEVRRTQALLKNQTAVRERNQALLNKGFLSQSSVDDALAQENALIQQLAVAKAQLAIAERNVAKARVLAPFDAKIERPIIAEGDYVKIGDPMFELVSMRVLNVYLPFPESLLPQLKVGQKVRLESPASGVLESQIAEIKAAVGATNRAVNAIVRLREQPGWHPGTTVNATVSVEVRPATLVVPEQSVVLRPAGKVVYVIEGGKAMQRVVNAGVKRDGWVEILSGLKRGETVALDGAGFLTDNAAVNVQTSTVKRDAS